MKRLTIFETSIIGFFIGVVVAAYLSFLTGTGGFVGMVISWVSLMPILDMFHIAGNALLAVSFIFVVVVYTAYGAIVGTLTKKYSKASIVAGALALLLLVGGSFEQVKGAASHVSVVVEPVYTAAVVDSRPAKVVTPPQQYFGNEVVGDLNADGKDDVAFLIVRNDPDRGILYYLVTALAFDGGKAGTNLIFVGEKISPQKISIESGVIGLEYMALSSKNSTSTSMLYAKVVDGVLEKTEKAENAVSVPVVTETGTNNQ